MNELNVVHLYSLNIIQPQKESNCDTNMNEQLWINLEDITFS